MIEGVASHVERMLVRQTRGEKPKFNCATKDLCDQIAVDQLKGMTSR